MDESRSPISIPGRVVVFDYGEVISRGPDEQSRARLLELAGVEAAPFQAAYDAHRDGLDKGTTSIVDYWKLVAADTGAHWNASRIHELWALDFTSWISVEPQTFDVVADLAAGGTRLAILSNAGFDFGGPLRFAPIARYFERIFISAEMLKIKPDAAIYLEVADELGITPEQMVFIDNKQVNVHGAEALGITGHHYVGASGLRSFLESL